MPNCVYDQSVPYYEFWMPLLVVGQVVGSLDSKHITTSQGDIFHACTQLALIICPRWMNGIPVMMHKNSDKKDCDIWGYEASRHIFEFHHVD